jgi:NADH dehydrogenase FAD-containing subunit
MVKMRPTVVIVGGGYGGAAVARALDDETEVILVEPKDAFVHTVATLRAVVRPEWASRIFIPYDRLLRHGRVVRESAVRVESMQVLLRSGQQLAAEYIVLATGSTYPFPARSDVDDSAVARHRYLAANQQLAGADRVLLLGAGPVGLELAGEILAEWPKKQVILVDPGADLLGTYSEELRRELQRQLDGLGVRLVLGSRLVGEPPTPPGTAGSFTVTTRSGISISADIWFRCHGTRPVTDYLAGDLAAARRHDGLLAVTPELRVEGQQAVFALGDITSIPESKRAGAASRHAQVVAANIKALATGHGPLSTYEPGPPAIVLPLGPHGGVSQVPGTGVAGAEQTSRLKGADLMLGRFLELFGHPAERSP